jgi:SAM-dependent methyltransferase
MLAEKIENWLIRLLGGDRYWGGFYDLVYWWLERCELSFLSYGYAPVSPAIASGQYGTEHFQLELYDQLALAIGTEQLAGRRLLEISCGLGGGSNYLKRYGPGFGVVLDRSSRVLRSAARRFGHTAVCADSIRLPFAARSFQTIVNVEASHRYFGNVFLREVARVLEPGGTLGIADFAGGRPDELEKALAQKFAKLGLELLSFRDISANVMHAMRQDAPRVAQLIRQAPWPFRFFCRMWAGGSEEAAVYRSLQSGKITYFVLVARRLDKPAEAARSEAAPALLPVEDLVPQPS